MHQRSVSVQPTPKGIELTDTVMPVLFEREKQFLKQFTKPESQTWTKLLRQFLLVFDANDK